MTQIVSVNRPAIAAGLMDYDDAVKPLVDKMPLTSCEVCAIVPVRDEADNLKATLLALCNQIDLQGKQLDKNRYEIIVLVNNCSDNSAEIARNFALTHPDLILHIVEITLNGDRAHIGWARKLLMDEACRRLRSIGRDLGIIASTDGDTRVTPTWLAATIAEIKAGADAVGGRIVTDYQSRSKLDPTTKLYFLRYLRYSYLTAQLEACLDPYFDPLPRHHYHYGASLAVTARIYAKAGGLPPLRSSEDVALYEALKRIDARFRHSPQVKVITSARAIGRAKAGLADRLSQLKMMAVHRQSMLVEPAELIKARFCLRRQLRYLWHKIPEDRTRATGLLIIARKLDLEVELLEETVLHSKAIPYMRASPLEAVSFKTGLSPTFGRLVEQIGQYQQGNDKLRCNWDKVPIQKAIADLEMMINQTPEHLSLDTLEQIEPISLLTQSF